MCSVVHTQLKTLVRTREPAPPPPGIISLSFAAELRKVRSIYKVTRVQYYRSFLSTNVADERFVKDYTAIGAPTPHNHHAAGATWNICCLEGSVIG